MTSRDKGAVEVITFGCRLNTYESEVMKAEAAKAGLDNAILVNTCAVTSEAVRQARQAIRRARGKTRKPASSSPVALPRRKRKTSLICPRSTLSSATRKS